MIIDQLDTKILNEFCSLKDNEYTTTWKLMKKFFPKGRDVENSKIKSRIERMASLGLFKVEGKPNIYTLDSNKVLLKKFSFSTRRTKAIEVLVENKFIVCEL